MTRVHKLVGLLGLAAAAVVVTPGEASACPICFGNDPNSEIGPAMNWAVFALLGVTGGVLSGFIGFIFHLIKRSRMALGQEQHHDQYQGERFDG